MITIVTIMLRHVWERKDSKSCAVWVEKGKRKLYNRILCVRAMESPVVEKRWWWWFIVLVVEVRQTKSCYMRPSTLSWKYFILILVIYCVKQFGR